MPDFSIKIIPGTDGVDQFQPDFQGSQPGDPLPAPSFSCVSFNNTTTRDHHITASLTSTYDSGDIPADGSSKVQYSLPSTTITYACTIHPKEQGQIILTNVQPMTEEE
ncbi:MAG TPA: hypothetical protein VFN10_10805 [Thermoanaerobaculia bacterium]|nr:hypothetical protein [Thermoanaerobaculia bacterium]